MRCLLRFSLAFCGLLNLWFLFFHFWQQTSNMNSTMNLFDHKHMETMMVLPLFQRTPEKKNLALTNTSSASSLFIVQSFQDLLDPLTSPLMSTTRTITQEATVAATTPTGGDLVVLFIGTSYLDSLTVWLHYYKKHQHNNKNQRRSLVLFTLDDAFEAVQHAFSTNQGGVRDDFDGTTTLIVKTQPAADNLSGLWVLRLDILNQLAHALRSFNFILSDVDALWLQDPQPLLDDHGDSDVVASRGTSPKTCQLVGSSTACFGFVYFRNTPAFRLLSARMAASRYGDDQRAINCIIRRTPHYQLVWTEMRADKSAVLVYRQQSPVAAKKNKNNYENNNILLPPDAAVANNHNLTVSLLSTKQVTRLGCKNLRGVAVAHCFAKKTGEKKLATLERFRLMPSDLMPINWTIPIIVDTLK